MNNTILETIKSRRSIRKFKPAQITQEELSAVLEAGTYAPSGRGLQCPLLVAVQGDEAMAQIVSMNAQVLGSDSNPYYGAPTVVLVFAPADRTTYLEDGTCVLNTMMLAAHSMDLASCWIHREKEMFEKEHGKALMKQWGIPHDYVGIGALALGYADCDLPAPPDRKQGRIFKV